MSGLGRKLYPHEAEALGYTVEHVVDGLVRSMANKEGYSVVYGAPSYMAAVARADKLAGDFDDPDEACWNCGGEGYVYGCSWDWQCDTYDEGEGTCLCTRPCHICHPPKPDPALQEVLREALASVDRNPEGEKPQALSAEHESAVPKGDAP